MARTPETDPPGLPAYIEPMKAAADDGNLVDDPRFAYEFKLDGYRAIMRVAPNSKTVLTSRNNTEFTSSFPELTGELGDALAGRAAVLDGEIVALNAHGVPDFSLLQNRRGKPTSSVKVNYYVFDLLQLGDQPLLTEPYSRRRELLAELEFPTGGRVSLTPAYTHAELADGGLRPSDLLTVARNRGLEGLVAKALDSRYEPGRRSPAWLKHALIQGLEVIIGGWQPGEGRRANTIGSLLLGALNPTGNLVYIGNVGTGFTAGMLDDLLSRLTPLRTPSNPFTEVPRDRARRAQWVRPELVGEIVYRQFTPDGRVRHTAWRGLRPDRRPFEVVLPDLRR
ncbi:non-homologous end-joining DNA ligase [Lentzea sp. NPDC092896]|uniref:non-homologous end-joining DNA ligase n=1 Tax=Lentzea sp. NPDC092896 TaxID=3364127 RepID=UPI0037F8DC2F